MIAALARRESPRAPSRESPKILRLQTLHHSITPLFHDSIPEASEKVSLPGCSKRTRGEARMERNRVRERDREIPTSTKHATRTRIRARRSSATKHMDLFQQP